MPASTPQTKAPANSASARSVHGIVIVGLDRPELVSHALENHPVSANGYSVPVFVVEPDATRAASVVDAGLIPGNTRVRVFAGERCVDDVLDVLRSQLACTLPRHITASSSNMHQLAQKVAAGIETLLKEQSNEADAIRASVAQRWLTRGNEYWVERFSDIRNGGTARILVATSRFSTFIRHSAEDLVQSFNALGHDARTLMEPDEHTNITPLLCLRAVEEFDPDVVVVINYTRAMHADLFPEGMPYVCWVQDAMPQLFQRAPLMPSSLDFVAGHVYPNAAGFDGYEPGAMLEFPVPISERKFHIGTAQIGTAQRNTTPGYSCDIAYVSHQSETADVFHREFTKHFPDVQRPAFDACRENIEAAIAAWGAGSQDEQLIEIKNELANALGRGDDNSTRDMVWHQYIHPLAERLLRHETLLWAAQIAREHNLTFQLFGNGWEDHPTLNEFAAGPLAHDEALRACYSSARVHLHASTLGCGHQRVYECAMSGGLVLCRRSWSELYRHDWARARMFIDRNVPADASVLKWKWPAYVIEHHAELRDLVRDRERMERPQYGWDHEFFPQVYAQIRNDPAFKYWDAQVPPPQMRAIEILGGPFELTFSTHKELEERIMRAVHDSTWRDQASSGVADRVRAQITMDRFAAQLVELVGTHCVSHPVTDTVEVAA